MCKCYPYHRHPRTTQELRRACDPDEARFTRGRRRKRRLPNAWDDIVNSRRWWRDHLNWKLLRRTRYRRIKAL